MKKISRRNFIIGCSSGISLSVLLQVNYAYGQYYNVGAFWKKSNSGPPNIRLTQFVARAAVLDTNVGLRTTQLVAKAAVLDTNVGLRTTQLVAKAAVLNTNVGLRATQVVLKVAVLP